MEEGWDIDKARDLYGIQRWGNDYFDINEKGHVVVKISDDTGSENVSVEYDVEEIVERLREDEVHTPLLLRFSHVLKNRIEEVNFAFQSAIQEYEYEGRYQGIFPIKVNQERHVVDEVLRFGKPFCHGLEAGSKPELILALGVVKDDQTPILCNGFKDDEYIETVLFARKMGRNIIPIVEKLSELDLIIKYSQKFDIKPCIGIRVKLASKGAGRWESSVGYKSKFGLTITEVLKAFQVLKSNGLEDALQLIHYHMGSQINNIHNIKNAINEAARIYVSLYKSGASLKFLDVGGGLGVDYDGTKSSSDSSINYSLQEYANDVVFQIKQVCDLENVPTPTIMSESGRALVAHHSLLITEVVGASTCKREMPEIKKNAELTVDPIIEELIYISKNISVESCLEHYHDTDHLLQKSRLLFNEGYLSLEQRSYIEELYWGICTIIANVNGELEEPHPDLETLRTSMLNSYFCNFSIFQSLPDIWAIDQVVPIMPIHRLLEEPSEESILVDITCDSDGKIERFVQDGEITNYIKMHKYDPEEKYYLGAFLVGAYQEVLGDIHNLFGDINAVHVSHDENGRPAFNHIIKGDTVQELLNYVHYDTTLLSRNLKKGIMNAIDKNRLTKDEAHIFSNFYNVGLNGYTYLEENRIEL